MGIKQVSIGNKIIGGFLVVALSLAVGTAVGIWSLMFGVHAQEEAAVIRLPAVNALWKIKEAQTEIMKSERSLLIPSSIPRDELALQKKRISDAWRKASDGMKEFESLPRSKEETARWEAARPSWEAWKKGHEKVLSLLDAGGPNARGEAYKASTVTTREPYQKSRQQLFDLIDHETAISGKAKEEFVKKASFTKTFVAASGAAGVALAILLGIALSSGISGSLNRTVAALSDGSKQVAAASCHLSSSSQGLADGSSEQAASLEETSSAMEEMSAMTKRNAESAGQAKSLVDRAGASVEKSNASMRSLVTSMAEISSMGEETGKIVKTIDEIAFQTNLLALNAAVEAARAGEAGAGFAVVADEVRNLAQRAAGAAKNTSELIEGTIKKIKDGTVLVEKTNADFGEVASAVTKVTELVAEISAASSEQSRGIDEVSKAIGQMDKVTQGNAAKAEEIATASEELSAQALAIEEEVRSLQCLVKGEGNAVTRTASASQAAPAARQSAGQAKSLADRAGASVEKSNASMRSLVTSMAEISSMGEETGKIVKTIDEIAFQTNLLALNAAVEAARAGEAGAGFAVVADEVRNLAQRAAGAAKNTSELIEGTIKKIKDGTVLVEKTNADFGEVASAVTKVTELVAEISAASSEQSRGIDEVSTAIGQMDKVTQGNAAKAEEIASASEELSAQVLAIEEEVRSLQSLVKGEGTAAARTASVSQAAPAARRKVALPMRSARAAVGSGKPPIPLEAKTMTAF